MMFLIKIKLLKKRLMKKILVIGGFGYIGSILVETLIKNKYSVNVLDKNLYGNFINKDILKNKKPFNIYW